MDERVSLFGIQFDRLTMSEAIDRLLASAADTEYKCRYVVTPNVDHVVTLQTDPAFRAAYRDADLVLVDGKPVLLASRLLGRPVPETVCGSDLLPNLLAASEARGGLSLFLLGAAEGVAEKAAENILLRWPWVRICGHFSPPMGFTADSPASETALAMIRSAAPDILAVGLGAPRQEIWVHAVRERLHVKTTLCVGATIDFLAGEKSRAPIWMRRAGVEWLHRMVSEPRRMTRRYVHDAWVFPRLVLAEWIKSR